MTVLLNAQREMADKFLDSQWETKWRQDKVLLEFNFCFELDYFTLQEISVCHVLPTRGK